MNKNIEDEMLKGAMDEIVVDENFKTQLRNTLHGLPNTHVKTFGYGVENGVINIDVKFEFLPNEQDFTDFVEGNDNLPLSVLKKFYEKYCNALISGRALMFHFITYSTVGSHEVLFSNSDVEGELAMTNLINVLDFNIELSCDVDVNYSNIFEEAG